MPRKKPVDLGKPIRVSGKANLKRAKTLSRLVFILFPDERQAIAREMDELGKALPLLPVRSRRGASRKWIDVGRYRYFDQQAIEMKLWHWQEMLRHATEAPDIEAKSEWVHLAYLRLGGRATNRMVKKWCECFGVKVSDANIHQTRDAVNAPKFKRDDEQRPVEIGDWKRWELCLPHLPE